MIGAFVRIVDHDMRGRTEDQLLGILEIVIQVRSVPHASDLFDPQVDSIEQLAFVRRFVALLDACMGTNCTPLISHCSLWKASSCTG